MFPAALTTSFAFMLPAGAPTNAIAFSYGYVKVRDMVSLFGPPREKTFHGSCDQARVKYNQS